jgi:putative drug exporter of the RND superfamily
MALLGNANWWLPNWLDRLLPHVNLAGDATPAEPAPKPEPIMAG